MQKAKKKENGIENVNVLQFDLVHDELYLILFTAALRFNGVTLSLHKFEENEPEREREMGRELKLFRVDEKLINCI